MIERAGSGAGEPQAGTDENRQELRVTDVAIVGAGAAGIGMGATLRQLGLEDFVILDRDGIGASFRRWPREMRFITPSFPGNAFGLMDLNAIALRTSPGLQLGIEHPTGPQYALYLQAVAAFLELPVETGVTVQSLAPAAPTNRIAAEDGSFLELTTSAGPIFARCVVWAAGEFGYPRLDPFPGAEHGLHGSLIASYDTLPGAEFVVIGGYESGVDAATCLHAAGKKVTLLERNETFDSDSIDPSRSLSPVSFERLSLLRRSPRVTLRGGCSVVEIVRNSRSWTIRCAGGETLVSPTRPILATGFRGSHELLPGRFELRPDGFPLLTSRDESTLTPGLFLSGPLVRQDEHIFCFIYKFRQRFAVVAKAIAERLGLDPAPLEAFRAAGMFLEDIGCCGESCVC